MPDGTSPAGPKPRCGHATTPEAAVRMKSVFCVAAVALLLVAGCGSKQADVGTAASLEELNRALSLAAMQGGGFPPSTNEIAKVLALSGKTMPVPPAGRKLVLDPVKRQFVLIEK